MWSQQLHVFSYFHVFSDCQNITLYFIISIHACSFVLIFVYHRWFVFCLYLSPQHCHWLFLTGTLTLPYPLVGLHCTIVTLFLLSVVHVCQEINVISRMNTCKQKQKNLPFEPTHIESSSYTGLHLLLNLLLLHFCNKRSPSECFLTGRQHPIFVIRAKFSEAIQHFDAICTGFPW